MATKKQKLLFKVIGFVMFGVLVLVAGGVTAAAISRTQTDRSDVQFTAKAAEPKPLSPLVLWIGDSYTEGTGANGQTNSFAAITSRALGYVPAFDAQGGTGFVADGKNNTPTNVPVPARLDKIRVTPQLVIVDVGRNDGAVDFRSVAKPAAMAYLDALRAKWPEAKIVLMVPYYIQTLGKFTTFANFYNEEAARIGAAVVDPISEGWFVGKDMPPMIYEDGIHPSNKGHDFIAGKLIDRFTEMGLSAVEETEPSTAPQP